MITDKLLRVSEDQGAITSTQVSTDKIDLVVARDIGQGTPLYMNFAVTTAFTGSGTVKFEVLASAAADLGTPTVIGSSDAFVGTCESRIGASGGQFRRRIGPGGGK